MQASAGSGKTTTAIGALKHCKGTTIFLAFNKMIATELAERGANARTFHSLCFGAVMKTMDLKNVEADKLRRIIKEKLSYSESQNYSQVIYKLVGLGKQSAIGILTDYSEFERLFLEHDLQMDGINGTLSEMFRLCQIIFDASINDKSTIDFDDMLYLAVKENIALPKYDVVFVDEAQDTNAIQREILKRIMKSTSRLIAVGDAYQSIYRFRGADSNAMELIKNEFNCIELPLSISYRCAKSIVAFAQRYSPTIEANIDSPEGIVQYLTEWSSSIFKPKDYVLCRTTRPLISLAYKCLNQRIPVTVLGREIGKGLENLIKKCGGTKVTIDELSINVDRYGSNEVKRLTTINKPSQIESLMDKIDTILSLIQSMPMSNRTVDELLVIINTLFAEKKNAVIFSTIHKSKGLEAERVYWLNWHECPPKWVKSEADIKQELNICYVAITRAKKELYLIKE